MQYCISRQTLKRPILIQLFNELDWQLPFVKGRTITLQHLNNHQERARHLNIINDLYYSTVHLKSEAKNAEINRSHCRLITKFITQTFARNVSSVGTPTVSSSKKQAKLYTSAGLP